MELNEVTAIEGKLEVTGVLRSVEWRHNTLSIGNMSLEEAYATLQMLKSHGSVGVGKAPTQGKKDYKQPEVQTTTPAGPPAAPAADASAGKDKKMDIKDVPAPTPEKKEAAAPKPEVKEPPKETKAPEPTAPVGNVVNIDTKRDKPGEIPHEVLSAKKLKDVLGYYMDRGIKEPSALIAECEKLKPHVPFLQRIDNISDRVTRALEVMGVSASA